MNLTGIDPSKPVQVYRNLNKPGCLFSVRQGGRVCAYVESIVLINATFKHATGKQLEAVRTGPRQVCQWITGQIAGPIHVLSMAGRMARVLCDPKKSDGFTVNGNRIDAAAVVSVNHDGCFASL